MQTSTGHLVSTDYLAQFPPAVRDGYSIVPHRLEDDALSALGGRSEARVDLAGDSSLVRWARRDRKKREAKLRRQGQRAARGVKRGRRR